MLQLIRNWKVVVGTPEGCAAIQRGINSLEKMGWQESDAVQRRQMASLAHGGKRATEIGWGFGASLLRDLGWEFRFEKRKLGEPDHKVHKFIMRGHKGDGARLFSVSTCWKNKKQWAQSEIHRVPFKHQKKLFVCFFTARVIEHHPESLWSLHAWRSPEPSWTICRGALQPQ